MKLDKSKLSKEEYRRLKRQILAERNNENVQDIAHEPEVVQEDVQKFAPATKSKIAFVLGNGTSRAGTDPGELQKYGKVYGCNALYRTHEPDYLIAVDTKMILEINKSGYQNNHEVWTNPNKAYIRMKNFNYFNPSKGWSSGPTALWLACQHGYDHIYILGFDYRGLDNGKKFNNVYADTNNYKKSHDGATFFGNWMRQSKSVINDYKKIKFTRVIAADNYVPDELNKFANLEHIPKEIFKNIYNLS